MQAERGSGPESDEDYLDSAADFADLEESSRSYMIGRIHEFYSIDLESGRGRMVSKGLGLTPNTGSVGVRCRAHVLERPKPRV
jgi:hypothetical protein